MVQSLMHIKAPGELQLRQLEGGVIICETGVVFYRYRPVAIQCVSWGLGSVSIRCCPVASIRRS
jgi:hypothetical protein